MRGMGMIPKKNQALKDPCHQMCVTKRTLQVFTNGYK